MREMACSVLFLIVFAGCGLKSNVPVPLRIEDINDRQVIGRLGLPLLQPATLTATIVGGDTKAAGYMFYLSVNTVNGVPCKGKPQFPYRVPPLNERDDLFGLVSDPSGFEDLQKRADGHRFTDARIGELRQRYPGTKLLIRAYETGSFYDGGPNELGLGSRHYLQTELIVLSCDELATNELDSK